MNIELRLRRLEAEKVARNGVFLIAPDDNCTWSFTTLKGKKKYFATVEDAIEAIHKKYGNPVIIVWDAGRTAP